MYVAARNLPVAGQIAGRRDALDDALELHSCGGGRGRHFLRLRPDDQRVAGVNPVCVPNVLVLLPDLWPQVWVAEILLRQRPQPVPRLDGVDLDVSGEFGWRLVGRPMVPNLVERARGRVVGLLRSDPSAAQYREDGERCAAHGGSPLHLPFENSTANIAHSAPIRQCSYPSLFLLAATSFARSLSE